jgi:hypothetical protein
LSVEIKIEDADHVMSDLFDLVQQLSQKFLRKNKDLDHEKLARDLGDFLEELEIGNLSFKEWNVEFRRNGEMYHTFTKKILVLPEKIISGFGVEEMVDKNHYLIQIFRLPLQDVPTLFNLLLVAMYTGFLLLSLRSNDFPEGIVKAYKDLKMHNMINYIERNEYTKLMDQMPDNITKVLTEFLVQSVKD